MLGLFIHKLFNSEIIGIILLQQTYHPTAHSSLFGYRCQPYFSYSIVYFIFHFDIYIGQKYYTKCNLILLTYVFFDVISLWCHIHGLV